MKAKSDKRFVRWSGASAAVLALASVAPASAVAAAPQQAGTASQSPTPTQNAPAQQSQVQAGDATPGSSVAAAPQQTADPADVAAEQATDAEATDQNSPDIVVTGTNLNSGFRAPTPVTVTTADQLTQSSPNNIADALIKLPVFGGSLSTSSPGSNATAGNVGQNLLNLRGLGTNRNLVLLDGRRIVANNTDFAIDVNTLPQNLVSRVDVVTGGASAAYGSDAVAGVVNFVLDTKFEGVKGEVASGISTYGDLPSGKYSLAVGTSLFGDRLHLIASTEYYTRSGLGVYEQNDREWYTDPAGLIPNTLAATPSNIVVPSIRASNGTAGGLIYTGPAGLRGTQFLANGVAAPFNYGTLSSAGFQNGGDGFVPNFGFTPDQRRSTSFAHASFDVTPDITAYAEFGYADTHTLFKNNAQPFTGAAFAFTIYNTNPYLPASVKAQMAAAGVTSFRLGRYLADLPEFEIETNADVTREAIGLKGVDLFGKRNLNWEVSYSAGQTSQYLSENNIANLRSIYAAADAVVNPQTNQVVCRSQFYMGNTFVPGGTGLDPNCKPLNLIGTNASNAALADTVNGTSFKRLLIHQDVLSAKLAGDFGDSLQLGAGPISFATGLQYRHDSANQTADAVSGAPIDLTGVRGAPAALQGRVGGYRFFNPLPFSGSQTVKEGFLELGIPVFKDVPFARALNLDGAVRYTDYSLAGGVTTWKGGVDYEPVAGVRLRGTVSRDVRAPNLLEIFNTALQNSQNVLYPSSTAGATTPSLTTTTGNPDLNVERALTQTYGVVLSPSIAPALHFSVDYYKIKLKGAIGALTAQNVVDFCAAGEQLYCSQLSFNNGVVNVNIKPLNLSVLEVEGLDFELSYRHEIFGNPLGLRLLVNRGLNNFSQAPNANPLVVLDSAIAPKWKAQAQINYDIDALSLFVNERFLSKVKMDPNKVEGVFTNDNSVPAIFYTDLTMTYKTSGLGGEQQFYLSVENLLNQDPPVDAIPPTSTSNPTNAAYDRVGRYFTAGFRFKF